MGEEEEEESLALTPTWVVAAVCLVIVAISLTAERLLHKLGKARLPLPELAAPSLPPELLCSAASTNLFPPVAVTTLIWLSCGRHAHFCYYSSSDMLKPSLYCFIVQNNILQRTSVEEILFSISKNWMYLLVSDD